MPERRLLRKKVGGNNRVTEKTTAMGFTKFLSAPKVIWVVKSREMRCDMYGDTRNAYRVSVQKLEGRRPIARSRRR